MTKHFTLELDPLDAKNGWMSCWLVFDGQRHYLDASSVFPPFGELLAFTKAIASNRLPDEFFWDEEGHGANLQAAPAAPGSPNFRLNINHDGEIVIDAEFDRMEVARGLLESLRDFALDCPGAESEWQFPYFLIEDFEGALASGFEVPSEAAAVGIARFVFSHFGGYGGIDCPAFSIWLDDSRELFMAMDDIVRHWQAWFELLEKIGRGELPSDITLHREIGDPPELLSLVGIDITFHYHAEALADPRHFRFKVIAITEPGERQVILDAVVDRRQFVDAFVESFENFLCIGYRVFLEGDKNRFDLRSLPLDRLIE